MSASSRVNRLNPDQTIGGLAAADACALPALERLGVDYVGSWEATLRRACVEVMVVLSLLPVGLAQADSTESPRPAGAAGS
ncbi:MAG: hypothetical protein AAF682_05345 [Planctomycetota bacterium]